MPGLSDRGYAAACAQLASHLGVSLGSARRRVEIQAAREGIRDVAGRTELAERLLAEAQASGIDRAALLDAQLEAAEEDDGFMLED
jgi:hypothetical protein